MSTPNDPLLEGLKPADLLQRGLESVKPPSGSAQSWQPPEPEVLAQLLPQYAIESLLGRGGMGAVYRGKQTALDRPIAIKLLPAELAQDAEFVGRFQREARTLAKLQHPGIVSVYDFGQTSQGHLYFVMEYVDGTDLHRIIHGPGLKPAQVLEIVTQVCDALQYAHTHGVMHRDIKPANLLITKDGRAKLADFGLARPTHEESGGFTRSNVVMGTPDYIAPEQMYGQADHRADLFSLGVMLYEMLTGQTPRGAWAVPSQRVRVDVRLDQVVLRALQQDVSLRYQQASEMKTDVDQIRFTPTPAPAKAALQTVAKSPVPPARPANAPAAPAPRQAPPPPAKNRKKKSSLSVLWVVTLPLMAIAAGYGWLSRQQSVGPVQVEAIATITPKEKPPQTSPEGSLPPPSSAEPDTPAPKNKPTATTPLPPATPSSASPQSQPVIARELALPVPDWLKEARQKGGRLKLFGTWKGQAISLGKAVEFDDFVKVVAAEHGWAAMRKNGETYAAAWPNVHLGPYQAKDLRGGHLISLLVQNTGSLGYRMLWDGESLRRDEVAHPQAYTCLHPYQLVVALSQDGQILKTSDWGGPPKKNPPSDFFLGFKAVASSHEYCLAAKPGQPPEAWNINNGNRTRFPATMTDVVSMDATNQSVIMLTSSGRVAYFSLPEQGATIKEISVPSGLTPSIAVKAGRTMYAAQRPDGTWKAWGHANDLIAQTERNGRMLDVDYDYQPNVSNVMLWIEPVSTTGTSSGLVNSSAPMPSKTNEKPTDEVTDRLAQLAAQFQAAHDRDIQSSYDTARADLDAKYLAAVQRALDAASVAGELEEAVKLREEVQRIKVKLALPSLDFDSLPDSLKKLRLTYRESITKLIVIRKTDAQPLYDRYDEVLAAYQTELTQQRRLDDAVRVKQAREELSRIRTQNTPPQVAPAAAAPTSKGIALFNGKTLDGWRIEGDKNAFIVVGDHLKANGPRGSLIYTDGTWKDFELTLKVMTENRSNSGVWIHSPKNPPDSNKPGLEVQICNDGSDVQKTGSIYSIRPVTNPPVRDGQWFDLKITVQDRTVIVYVNGNKVNEWTQPAGWRPPPNISTASLGRGTIGLQSNGGATWFKEIYIR